MEIWKPQRIEPTSVYQARVGPLVLWLSQAEGEMHVAQTYELEKALWCSNPLSGIALSLW